MEGGGWQQGLGEVAAGNSRGRHGPGLKAAAVRVKELAASARPGSRHPAAQGWSSGDSVRAVTGRGTLRWWGAAGPQGHRV